MAFTVAGAGTSFCFPTVANAVMSSVPAGIWIASALSGLGMLAAVLAAGRAVPTTAPAAARAGSLTK